MKKVMFSVHVGDSVAHVFRTRSIAKSLLSKGFEVVYSVPSKALPYLKGFTPERCIYINDQNYSFAQFPNKLNNQEQFSQHALNESLIYKQTQPDFIVGDTGIISSVYNPAVPFIKIFNRFYVEIASDIDSPYSPKEKMLIMSHFEDLVNSAREKLGFESDFKYDEFVAPPAIINGASYFTEDIPNAYKFSGIHLSLLPQKIDNPDDNKCLVVFGTGLTAENVQTASKLLMEIEKKFETIYVSYGVKIKSDDLYHPKNAIMRPLFREVPDNVGCLICHGGWGAIHLGVQLGIPVIAMPFQIEQFSNAYHMEKAGVGMNVGSYDTSNFKGLLEKTSVDFDKFEYALQNFKSIRRVGVLENSFGTNTDLLLQYIVDFIFSSE